MTDEERTTLDKIRHLYHPATLTALDVQPLPTIIRHVWYLLDMLELEEIQHTELRRKLLALAEEMRVASPQPVGPTIHDWANRLARVLMKPR